MSEHIEHLYISREAALTGDEKGSTTGWFCCADDCDCDCDWPCDCPCPCDCDCVGVAAEAAPSEFACTYQHYSIEWLRFTRTVHQLGSTEYKFS